MCDLFQRINFRTNTVYNYSLTFRGNHQSRLVMLIREEYIVNRDPEGSKLFILIYATVLFSI